MLAEVEKRFEEQPFVCIGVHSPKFPNERDAEMVREAVRRYGITHPVVVDSDHAIWQQFGVNAWPTLVLVDPEGYVIGASSGEPDLGSLSAAVERVLEDARAKGSLRDHALPLRREPVPAGSLAYPGKIIVAGDHIFVADTGHDQVVVARADGSEEFRIGSGESGLLDGSLADARFHHPIGMALANDTLYVCDTGNHAVRAVDLSSGRVRSFQQELRSPWDLAWDGARLYIAMAGTHQIWVFDPASGMCAPFAGTGREVRIDGPVARAAFAQPSGLALLNGTLYVADSEISTVRAIEDLDGEPVVRTVCGSGDLFGWGDVDGAGDEVRLQHCIGIAAGDGVLYLADTYNHKVKQIDPRTGECMTLFGSTEPERLPEVPSGYALKPATAGTPAFFEPEGIAHRNGELLVADTNNHRILAIALATGERRALLGG